MRNSWGSAWGEHGFAKVCRGKNVMGIETDCQWAMPVDTWTEEKLHHTTEAEQDSPLNDKTVYPFPQHTFNEALNTTEDPE